MKAFDQIIGNDLVKTYLTNMIKKEMTHHSLLFAGLEGIGKSLFAEELAKLILNVDQLKNHPDLYIYRPEGKLGAHSIESMRQMCEKVYLQPFSAKKKVFIIHNAEKMLPTSANSLLKTFEEPSPDTVIILLSNNPGAILPTILSRCRTVRFQHISEEDIATFLKTKCNKGEEEAKKIAEQSAGSIGRAFRLCEGETDLVREQLLNLLKKGKVKLYAELVETAKSISETVEDAKKAEEVSAKAFLTKDYQTDLTAAQTQNLNKEIEGAIAVRQADFSIAVFEVILSWYRDLHLLRNQGNKSLLINKDCLDDLLKLAKQEKLLSIEAVLKIIAEAKLLLDRSTSLHIALENLFLKLSLI